MKKIFLTAIITIVSISLISANAPGYLAVQALDGVEISVDGELRGITYNGQLVVMLDPGTYTLTAEKEGYGSSSHRVEIKSGEATNLKIEMQTSRVQSE